MYMILGMKLYARIIIKTGIVSLIFYISIYLYSFKYLIVSNNVYGNWLDFTKRLLGTERKFTIGDLSKYMHEYKDTAHTGFNVTQSKLNFLPNFKNPCWFEAAGTNVYKRNKFLTTNFYPKKAKLGEKLARFPSNGINVQLDSSTSGTLMCRLRCLPYFMLLGVAKSGTSDLYFRLNKHPDIYGGVTKETYWWSQLRFHLLNATLGDFADLFDRSVTKLIQKSYNESGSSVSYYPSIIGDYTSMTFYDMPYWRQNPLNYGFDEPQVLNPYDIYQILPNTKFIVIFRNPTARLYSHYNLFRKGAGSPADFHKRVIGSIWWWETCLKVKELKRKACSFGSPPEMPPIYSELGNHRQWWVTKNNYSGEIRFGMYAIQAAEWLKVFPRSNFLFIKMEEHSSDQEKSYNEKIFPFLGVDKLYGEELENLLQKGPLFQRKYAPMLETTKQLLDKFYEPYNRELAMLLNDDKWLWND